jgi:chromosome segregation and condensation protein ScpB
MRPTERQTRLTRDKNRAAVRALHLSELEEAGARRSAALAEADAQLDRVARLLSGALRAGLTLAEIARVAGVSRPTLYELRARYSESDGDLRLGVLQSVAWLQPATADELAEHLGRDRGDISETLKQFMSEDLISLEPRETKDGAVAEYELTPNGSHTLEHWVFLEEREPGEIP